MYLIVDSTKRVVEVCEHPSYVRRQANGVVILSDKEHADAIYSNDSNTFWAVAPIGYLCESHTLIEVESVPAEVVPGFYYYYAGEFYTTEADLNALAESKAPYAASIVFVKMAESGELDDVTITEHAEQFPAWVTAFAYAANAICTYGGKIYRCLQAHTSQENWTPDVSASLWKEIGDPAAGWPAWSQPIGAVDVYATGDKVSHNDKHWVSTCYSNVWEPGVYGWEEVTE